MIRKTTLFVSAGLAVTLSSADLVAADFDSPAELQTTFAIPFPETALVAMDAGKECVTIDNSTAAAWNTGEICLASDLETSAAGLRAAGSKVPQDEFGAIGISGAECVSAGGSTAANEDAGGFCVASDLNTSIMDVANFSVANGLPVLGMQFLQATFGDGSTLGAGAPIGAECVSVGGSTSASENGEGFCLVSDLSRSITDFANFSVANGFPVVGLQFLQITFAAGGSLSSTGAATECVSVGGSTAAAGTAGGFCLASDISTSSTEGSANFSVAHDTPVADMQFLQVTFGNGDSSGGSFPSPGAGAPVGAECVAVDGSIGAIGNPEGFCLVSDLIGSSAGSANISVANDLPVSGLQFLQVSFGDGSSLGGSPPAPGSGAPIGVECVSADGSTAATGNAEGFCLASDLITATMGSANFSVANDLPVTAWEFLQVPSEGGIPFGGSSHSLGPVAPVGVVVSNFVALPFDLRFPPALAGVVGHQTRYFHISDQTNGIETYSTPYWRTYPHLALWLSR